MPKDDAVDVWSLNYRLLMSVIASVAPKVTELGLEVKELFLLSDVGEGAHPAELAHRCSMPKPTVTVYLKRLEAAGFVRRQIDPNDLRRHRIEITAAGRKVVARGHALLSEAFGSRLDRLDASERRALRGILEKMS